MGDPDDRQKQINLLRTELRWIYKAISSYEGNLNNYAKDYEKYNNALDTLDTIQKDILNGQTFLSRAKTDLSYYASGNQEGVAQGAISSAGSIFGSAAGGIDAIKTIIETDMELLNEKYVEEYKKYDSCFDDYNRTTSKIRSLGGAAADKSPTITKKKLG